MGKLSRHQRSIEKFNLVIYEQIVSIENSLIEENRTEVRTNTIILESYKDNLEKNLTKILLDTTQEEENKYVELEQKVRKPLADISAKLLEAWNYLKINGPLLDKEFPHPDLDFELTYETGTATKPLSQEETLHVDCRSHRLRSIYLELPKK